MTTPTEASSLLNSPAPATLQAELDASFPIGAAQTHLYAEHGYITLKHVLSPTLLEHYRKAIHERVAALSLHAVPLNKRDTYRKAFLQIMNLSKESPKAKEFVSGKRLAPIAAELMGATGARIYHDQALHKKAGGGITPSHADQYYWPVGSDRTAMAWVPLQDTFASPVATRARRWRK